jgi:hypothetical protein
MSVDNTGGAERGAQIEWNEAELEGRYQVVLTVDTGLRESLPELTSELCSAARGLTRRSALGYRVDVVYVVAGHNRKPL